MTLADAEEVEKSVAESEAVAWVKMVAWVAEAPGRRGSLAGDPDVKTLTASRRCEFMAAVCRIVEHADRQPSERVMVPAMG